MADPRTRQEEIARNKMDEFLRIAAARRAREKKREEEEYWEVYGRQYELDWCDILMLP